MDEDLENLNRDALIAEAKRLRPRENHDAKR
jgi:hypothetical protein